MVREPENINILVVEDEENLRNFYSQLLVEEGYNVDSASDGFSAYEKIIKGNYNLVLLDLMLPKMDGLSIIRKLNDNKKNVKNSLPKILVMTNLGQDKILTEAISSGACGYFMKFEMTPDLVLAEVKKQSG